MKVGVFLVRGFWLCKDLASADNGSFGGPLQFLLSYQGVRGIKKLLSRVPTQEQVYSAIAEKSLFCIDLLNSFNCDCDK